MQGCVGRVSGTCWQIEKGLCPGSQEATVTFFFSILLLSNTKDALILIEELNDMVVPFAFS
jgi:hypothetical protein